MRKLFLLLVVNEYIMIDDLSPLFSPPSSPTGPNRSVPCVPKNVSVWPTQSVNSISA